ncbi:hypothetical protein [Dactylosporangium darangshiense]|uniref:hypothetical protein n=1 Tax=Dactylosporangium darangshiense TaxID=579108 RepID=UPI0031E75D58
MSTRKRWLLAVSVLAALALLAGAAVGVWRWQASRDPKVDTALPDMDRALADVLAAAGDEPAVAVNGLVRAATCPLGVLRTGGRYSRTAELYVAGGDEDTLIGRIAQRLPATYQAHRDTVTSGSAPPLTADLAGGVRVSVRQLGIGWLVADAATGCVAGPATTPDSAPPPEDPAVPAITTLLDSLGTAPAILTTTTLDCPAGQIRTVAAISRSTDSGRLADRLTVPAGARTYLAAGSNRVAYRDGTASIIVAASDDGTAITVRRTTPCR